MTPVRFSLKIFFSISLVVSFACMAIGQTQNSLKGRVYDKQTGEPLPGASVSVPGVSVGTSTGENGRFQLPLPLPRDSIKVTYVGYLSRIIPVEDSSMVRVGLKASAGKLHEVTITDSLHKQEVFNTTARVDVPKEDVPVTMEGVSRESIEQRQDDNLEDALQHATGVRPMNRYGGFLTFRMRGFGDFLMMVDQVRDERHNLSNSAPFSNLASVKRIDVLRGPASAMYGHSALGGIINVIRNQPSRTTKADFSATYGSFNTQKIQAGAGGPVTKDLRYRVDFGMHRTDGWRDYGLNRNNGYLALDYDLSDKDKLSLRLSANSDRHDTDAGLPLSEDGGLADGLDPSTRFDHPSSFLEYQKYGGQIRYQHRFNDNLVLSNRLSASFDDINYSASEGLAYNADKDSISRTFHLFFNHETIPVQNQLELSWETQIGGVKHKIAGGHTFNYLDRQTYRGGVDASQEYFMPMSVQDPQTNRGTVAFHENLIDGTKEIVNGFYIQDWTEVTDGLKVMASGRLDLFNGSYYNDSVNTHREITYKGERTRKQTAAFTYRGGFVYRFLTNTRFYGSYGTYFKPSRSLRNGELFDPVTGDQAELGLRWKMPGNLRVNVAAYSITKKNMVVQTGVRNGNKVFDQIGKAHSQGIEINGEGRIASNLTFTGGYSYNLARFGEQGTEEDIEGNRLAFAPRDKAHLWANYSVHKGILKGVGLGIGGRHVGKNYADESNKYYLPAYTLLNGSLSYSHQQWSVNLKVNNITDETYFTDAILNNQVFPGAPVNYKLKFSWEM